MPKAGKFFEKIIFIQYSLYASKYPDILSEFLKQILNKSDFL
jgi:hypothetical protein